MTHARARLRYKTKARQGAGRRFIVDGAHTCPASTRGEKVAPTRPPLQGSKHGRRLVEEKRKTKTSTSAHRVGGTQTANEPAPRDRSLRVPTQSKADEVARRCGQRSPRWKNRQRRGTGGLREKDSQRALQTRPGRSLLHQHWRASRWGAFGAAQWAGVELYPDTVLLRHSRRAQRPAGHAASASFDGSQGRPLRAVRRARFVLESAETADSSPRLSIAAVNLYQHTSRL